MNLHASFSRASRAHPCPVCSKPDWCMIGRAGTDFEDQALCQRVASARPVGAAGSLHRLNGKAPRPGALQRLVRAFRPPPSPTMALLATDARVALSPQSLRVLSDRLGVTRASLGRLGVGQIDARLAAEHDLTWALGAWTFPMRDAAGTVVGIRLRLRNGDKRSVTGGREGLFVPISRSGSGPLLVCEGPSDTAAMLDLGFDAVGVPSAGACGAELVQLVKCRGVRAVVVVADSDAPGRKGAAALAAQLAAHVADVRVIEPPDGVKDAREWRCSGASSADVEEQVDQAAPWTLHFEDEGAA